LNPGHAIRCRADENEWANWVLKRSPVMLPIPGTSKVAHLEENIAAVHIQLSDEEFAALGREGRKERAS